MKIVVSLIASTQGQPFRLFTPHQLGIALISDTRSYEMRREKRKKDNWWVLMCTLKAPTVSGFKLSLLLLDNIYSFDLIILRMNKIKPLLFYPQGDYMDKLNLKPKVPVIVLLHIIKEIHKKKTLPNISICFSKKHIVATIELLKRSISDSLSL